MEYDRKLNVGDVELVEFISRYLTETLKELVEKTDQTGKMMHYFTRMLLGQTISDTEQEYWKQYVCWSSERDYRICVLMFEEELSAQKAISVRNMIQNIFSQVLAVNYDGNIVFSISDIQLEYLYRSRLLNDLLQHVRFRAGLSLPYKKLAEFFNVVEDCVGRVQLITEEGDVLNLKSKLSRLVAISSIFSNSEIGDLELVCAEKEDIERLMNFMMNGNSMSGNK